MTTHSHWLVSHVLLLFLVSAAVSARVEQQKPFIADAVGNFLPKPSDLPAKVGSPSNLLHPDKYEFYTFDESGELIRRYMTLEEIKSIVATDDEDDHMVTIAQVDPNKPTIAFNFSQTPNVKIHSVVENVQNVLKAELEAHKNNPPNPTFLDTPDVSASWSMILPSIFGNTGVDIVPDNKQNNFSIPETDTIESDLQEDEKVIKPIIENKDVSSTLFIDDLTSTEHTKFTNEKQNTTEITTTNNIEKIFTEEYADITNLTAPILTSYITEFPIHSMQESFTTVNTPSIILDDILSENNLIEIYNSSKNTTKQTIIHEYVNDENNHVSTEKVTNNMEEVNKESIFDITTNIVQTKLNTFLPTTNTPYEHQLISTKKYNTMGAEITTTTLKTDNDENFKPIFNVEESFSQIASDLGNFFIPTQNTENANIPLEIKENNDFNIPMDSSTISFSTDKNPDTTSKTLEYELTKPSNILITELYEMTSENSNKLTSFDKTTHEIVKTTTKENLSTLASNFPTMIELTTNAVLNKLPELEIPDAMSVLISQVVNDSPSQILQINSLDSTTTEGANNRNEDLDIITTTEKRHDMASIQDVNTNIIATNSNYVSTESVIFNDLDDILNKKTTQSFSTLNSKLSSNDDVDMPVTETHSTFQSTKLNMKLETISEFETTNLPSGTTINDINTSTNIPFQTTSESKQTGDKILLNSLGNTESFNDESIINSTNLSETVTTIKPFDQSPLNDKFNTSNDDEQTFVTRETTTVLESSTINKNDKHDIVDNTTPFSKTELSSMNLSSSSNTLLIEQVTSTNEKEEILNKIDENSNIATSLSSLPENDSIKPNSTSISDLINLTEKTPPKLDDSKKKVQKVNIDIKEQLENSQNSTWTLIPTVIPSDKYNNFTNKISDSSASGILRPSKPINMNGEPNKKFDLSSSTENQGLLGSTQDLSEDILQFTELCNELAFKYWSAIENEKIDKKRSLVFSPFSVTSMLAMIFMGARGSTSGEMNEILKLDDMVTFNPHYTLKNISDSIEISRQSGVAVSAFVRELYSDRSKGKLLSFYKDRAQQFYNGHVEEINFKLIKDLIRRRTNLLVKRYTWGKVPEYMKGNFIHMEPPLAAFSVNIFETDCSEASTEGRDGEMYFVVSPTVRQRRLVPVPAALLRRGFLAGYEPALDATAAALGPSVGPVSLVLLMPGQQGGSVQPGDLDRLQERLLSAASPIRALDGVLRTLRPRSGLELQIPRFSHRSLLNVSSALRKMGLHDLFDPKRADLRGLNGQSKDLYLSDATQSNALTTCGEGPVGEQHHVEAYPAEPQASERRKRSSWWRREGEEPRDYQRAFHDPHDMGALALPLHLRPRQARLPAPPLAAAEPARLKFDRPFLFFVRHNPTGMILYMGRYNPRLLP